MSIASIFPLQYITQPVPAEYNQDTLNQILALINAQCVSAGSIISPASLTVADNVFTIQNHSDNTKQVQFSAADVTTGTTATFATPAANDTLVGIAATQTLTNKTLTAPSVTGLKQDVGNALTAAGSSSRTGALALTHTINNVTTAAADTGVILPAATIGATIVIFNNGVAPMQVYGAGSDTIDTETATTGVTLTNASRCLYMCVAAATWISAQLGAVSS